MVDENNIELRASRCLAKYQNNIFEQYTPVIGQIIQDICLYIYRGYNKDLFNYVDFSITDFCKEFGYNKNIIRGKVKEEVIKTYNKELIGSSSLECDSLLDFAVYKGLTEPFRVITTSKTDQGEKTSFELYQMFSGEARREGRQHKKIYHLRLGAAFSEEYFNNYIKIKFSDYKNLRTNDFNLTSLYRQFYLSSSLQKNYTPIYETTVDRMAAFFKIKSDKSFVRKKEVKRHLDNLQKMLPSFFSYEFFRQNSDHCEYRIRFKYLEPNKTSQYDIFIYKLFENSIKTFYYNQHGIKEAYNAYYTELLNKELKIKPTNSETIHDEKNIHNKFFDWFFSHEDAEKKRDLYLNTFHYVYNRQYPADMSITFDQNKIDEIINNKDINA